MKQLDPTLDHLGDAHKVWLPGDGAFLGGLSPLFFMSGSGGTHHTDRQNPSRPWGSRTGCLLPPPPLCDLPAPPPHYTHHHTHTAPSYHLGGLDPSVPALFLQKRSLVLQALSLLFLHLEDKSQNALCPGPSLPPLLTELLRFRVSPGFLCPFSPTLAQFHSG